MSNNTHDNMPVEEINKRKPRSTQDWDKTETDLKKGKKNGNNS